MSFGRRLYGRNSLHQSGIENVVTASSGTALTNNKLKLIKRLTENVTILLTVMQGQN